MAYVALYRKYRPKTFDEVVGQDTIIKILKNSIINDRIGHAYLFSGPKGTGKTSVAKIFSRAINCLSNNKGDICQKCDVCKITESDNMDIVELDAASNNGVDEIREIIDNASLMPSFLKYKVYIIDEAHMLSTSAFNALLKTLEEPPKHVIFILATTELEKIMSTVLSRCQKLDFKKIPSKTLEKQLEIIVKREKKSISKEVLSIVAEESDGAFRDAINIIDQLLTMQKEEISINDVYDLLGDIKEHDILEFVHAIVNSDIKTGLDIISRFSDEGKNYTKVSSKLLSVVRDIVINNNVHDYFKKEYEQSLDKFSEIDIAKLMEMTSIAFELNNSIKKSTSQRMLFETNFIRMCLLFNNDSNISLPCSESDLVKSEIKDKTYEHAECENNKEEHVDSDIEFKKIRVKNTLAEANIKDKNDFLEKFGEIDDYISNSEYNAVINLMKKSIPEVVSKRNILFSLKNRFEVVLFDKNIDLITKFLKEIYGIKYDIVSMDIDIWKKVKEKYIEDKKNGIIYEYEKENKTVKKNKKTSALEKEAENIFGEDIISVD